MPYCQPPLGAASCMTQQLAKLITRPPGQQLPKSDFGQQSAFPWHDFIISDPAQAALVKHTAALAKANSKAGKHKVYADGLYVTYRQQWVPLGDKPHMRSTEYFEQIRCGCAEVEARVVLQPIQDPCHPVHLNPFSKLEHISSDGFALGTFAAQDLRKGDLLGIYYGYIVTCKENEEQCNQDHSYATAVRRSFTFDLQWSFELEEKDASKQLVILGHRDSCKMACVNDPTCWVGHPRHKAPLCQAATCNCKAYMRRKANVKTVSAVMKVKAALVPVLLYIADCPIRKDEEVLVSYGDDSFFDTVWRCLDGYNFWLAGQKELQAQRREVQQLRVQLAAAGPPQLPRGLTPAAIAAAVAPMVDGAGLSALGAQLQAAAAAVMIPQEAAGFTGAAADLGQLLQQFEQHARFLELQLEQRMPGREQQKQEQRQAQAPADHQQQAEALQKALELAQQKLHAAQKVEQQLQQQLQAEERLGQQRQAAQEQALGQLHDTQQRLAEMEQQLAQCREKLAQQAAQLSSHNNAIRKLTQDLSHCRELLPKLQAELKEEQRWKRLRRPRPLSA